MCGIAGFIVKKDDRPLQREKLLDALLLAVDHRGGDATGFVARNPQAELVWHKASCDAKYYCPRRPSMPAGATIALGHTRFATQGHQSFPENNHPVRRGNIYVTHNGSIVNDWELFNAMGRDRFGAVDTEVIAAGLSAAGELGRGSIPLLESLEGTAAIACLDDRDGTVLLARVSSSPLYLLESRRLIVWGSEATAIETAHVSAVGSLGRLKAEGIGEGRAIVIRDGAVCDSFTFKPAPSHWQAWKPTGKLGGSTGAGDSTGACPLPAVKGLSLAPVSSSRIETVTTRAIAAEDHSPLVGDGPLCDACGAVCDDQYDLFDGHDLWGMCQDCWESFAAVLPQGLRAQNDRNSARAGLLDVDCDIDGMPIV